MCRLTHCGPLWLFFPHLYPRPEIRGRDLVSCLTRMETGTPIQTPSVPRKGVLSNSPTETASEAVTPYLASWVPPPLCRSKFMTQNRSPGSLSTPVLSATPGDRHLSETAAFSSPLNHLCAKQRIPEWRIAKSVERRKPSAFHRDREPKTKTNKQKPSYSGRLPAFSRPTTICALLA